MRPYITKMEVLLHPTDLRTMAEEEHTAGMLCLSKGDRDGAIKHGSRENCLRCTIEHLKRLEAVRQHRFTSIEGRDSIEAYNVEESWVDMIVRRFNVNQLVSLLGLRDVPVEVVQHHAEIDMRLRMAVAIYARTIKHLDVAWPSNWWQHFRARWLPKWWLKKKPVKMERLEVAVEDLYPQIPVHDGTMPLRRFSVNYGRIG
jgi:hypothetical protein